MLDSHHWQWRVSGSSTCCLKSYVTLTHPRWRLSKRDWMNTSVRYRISQLYQIVAEQLPATVCFTSFRCWEPSDRIESNNTLTRQDKWSVSVSRCSKVCSWHYCLQFEMEKRCEWIHLLGTLCWCRDARAGVREVFEAVKTCRTGWHHRWKA